MIMDNMELPMNFNAALSKNDTAMEYFSTLTPAHKREIIAHAHSIRSKEVMEKFVSRLDQTLWI